MSLSGPCLTFTFVESSHIYRSLLEMTRGRLRTWEEEGYPRTSLGVKRHGLSSEIHPAVLGLSFSICKMWLLDQPVPGSLGSSDFLWKLLFVLELPWPPPNVSSPLLSLSHFCFVLHSTYHSLKLSCFLFIFCLDSNPLSTPCEQGLCEFERATVTLAPKIVLGT